MSEPAPATSVYSRFLPWRRSFEIGFWVALTLVNGIANSITVLIDIRRTGLHFAAWEPALWEWSSGLVFLLIVPLLVLLTRHCPLHWDNWRRRLPAYLLGSVALSVLHVLGMVAIRSAVYRLQGLHYDFGPWPQGLAYEYLKDVRSLASMLLCVEMYRFLLRRWQGEAALLGAPDEGPPVEPLERPERFLVRKLGREFLVAAADIEWLQASGNYVNLRVRGHDYPLRSTMAAIEARLDPARFVRIHRSYMVNLACVVSIEPLDAGEARVHLRDGSHVPCSRRYRAALRAAAGEGEAAPLAE
ncbi:LytTR family transcriptional regulator [Xanthomonas sp. AM6]|uniref:LytTR family DNA-binding domain-containing protein n=1 Tax=Xanthomonas sp. AM6 TaxID=2982531 RepID=UPI0021D99862|nr:LytTR family DNA-binding domain-containing protein [Xanthomonas sp. AM6]UYB50558.1 LytTR family transcriptional regulator [Xanthomonas sp. AM6]